MLAALLAAAHAADAADGTASAAAQQWPRRALQQATQSPTAQLQQE